MSVAGGIGGRTTSWEILRNEGIRSLPVDPLKIAYDNRINIITYAQLATQRGLDERYYEKTYSESGFAYFRINKFHIAYNDSLPQSATRYTIMHELAHIFAGDIGPDCTILQKLPVNDYREIEAHRMTRRVLCPSVVLHMCGCKSPDEIQALCGVDKQVSEHRFAHLQFRRKENQFFKSTIEQEVMVSFLDFISEYISHKCLQK